MNFDSFYKNFLLSDLSKLSAIKWLLKGRIVPSHVEFDKQGKPTRSHIGCRFWNSKWNLNIRYGADQNRNINELIVELENVEHQIYYAFHFHPTIKDSGTWDCYPTYEKGPHFHLFQKDKIKVMADHEFIPLIPFLLFVASFHHGGESEFQEFRRDFCTQYREFGLAVSPLAI